MSNNCSPLHRTYIEQNYGEISLTTPLKTKRNLLKTYSTHPQFPIYRLPSAIAFVIDIVLACLDISGRWRYSALDRGIQLYVFSNQEKQLMY